MMPSAIEGSGEAKNDLNDGSHSSKRRVLIAEDNAAARQNMQRLLEADDFVVDTAEDGSIALEMLLERPYSVIVTDLKMPKVSGMDLIEEVQKRRLAVAVIVTTGNGSIDEAVQAMRLGATDFLTKPIDVDHLRLVVQRALRERALQDEVTDLRERLYERFSFQNILSKHPKMHAIFELIGHVGTSATTVLIEGETGTGKELVARAIHQASISRDGPFVAINCAAVPETLLESELFGHEKGAFTSAVGQRKGRFEMAHGGTLFLDEVGDVPAPMQAKLLRVLQERCFERVGGSQTIQVDVRLVAATNRNLQRLVQEGKFREDLYYRLNVVKIDLPPLRERVDDIPLLVTHFCAKFARTGSPPKTIAPEAMDALLQHRWPGNIRELENAIERACATSRAEIIGLDNLPREVTQPAPAKLAFSVDLARPLAEQVSDVVAAFEARYLKRALRKARGDISRVAKITGLPKTSVAEKLSQYKIDQAALEDA